MIHEILTVGKPSEKTGIQRWKQRKPGLSDIDRVRLAGGCRSIIQATATGDKPVLLLYHVGWSIVMEKVLQDFLMMSSYLLQRCFMTGRIGSVDVKTNVKEKISCLDLCAMKDGIWELNICIHSLATSEEF